MQLLQCSPHSTAEFASLSLLMKNDNRPSVTTVASPYATIPFTTASACIRELEDYVTSVSQVAKRHHEQQTGSNNNDVEDQLLLDESHILESDAINTFTPSHGHGVALYFTLIQEKGLVQKCAAAILGETANNTKMAIENAMGIVLSVGVSGLPFAHSSSALVHTLSRRMLDFKSALQGLESFSGENIQTCLSSLLSTLLLFDDEELKTNSMINIEQVTFLSESTEETPLEKMKSPIGAVRKNVKARGGSKRASSIKGDSTFDFKLEIQTAMPSADVARIAAEKVAILSVAEHESQLQMYKTSGVERRTSMASNITKKARRRRKGGMEADLDGFDCPATQPQKGSPARVQQLKPPGADTASQMNVISPNKTLPKKPLLAAPRNDVAIHRRNSGQHASSRRFSIHAPPHVRGAAVAPSDAGRTTGQAAFNAFATESSSINESFVNGSFPHQQFAGVPSASPTVNSKPRNNKSSQNGHYKSPRDAWGMSIQPSPTQEFTNAPQHEESKTPRFELASPSDERETPAVFSPNSQGSYRTTSRDEAVDNLQRLLLAAEKSEMNGLRDDDDTSRGSRSVGSFQNGEWLQGMDEELRSAHSELDELVAKVTPADAAGGGDELQKPRLMVNVALNEDLTCSYRQSKMSSCSIEGVVQVQVSCDTRNGVPFYLNVRDPSRHIRIVQENKRFSDASIVTANDVGIDHKYTVSVPSVDDYFPVLRYKCSSELRPVPIRVQTRVRVNEGASCRVALQISSNPANEDDLTDLTIVMGVPLEVKGETLVTTPAGGVWNAAKRSVIWCVAELGEGEKFQLQAEFAMDPKAAPLPPGTKPKFPVLVRCQCMYAQLSDVELEVSDIADVFPADATMKMARRFRLSHRERS